MHRLSSARSLEGVRDAGKYLFLCRYDRAWDVPGSEPKTKQVVRVGWSTSDHHSDLDLGVSSESLGYGSSGFVSNSNRFDKVGTGFEPGDAVGCLLDLDAMRMSFTRNGEVVENSERKIPSKWRESTFYPHVSVRNAQVTAYLGPDRESKEPAEPPAGYTYVYDAPSSRRSLHLKRRERRSRARSRSRSPRGRSPSPSRSASRDQQSRCSPPIEGQCIHIHMQPGSHNYFGSWSGCQ